MGQWFKMVCHTCKKQTKCLGKLAEIQLNASEALLIGHFASEHASHQLELRGDEYTKDGFFSDETVEKYEQVTPEGPYIDDTVREFNQAYAVYNASMRALRENMQAEKPT